MAHAWKACWGQPLASSNLASSAGRRGRPGTPGRPLLRSTRADKARCARLSRVSRTPDGLAPPLALALTHTAAAAAAAVALAVVLVHAGPLGEEPLVYGYPFLAASYAAAGLLAWWRRPANRLGPLLVAAGGAWLTAGLQNTGVPALVAVGLVTSSLPLTLLIHLVLAAPGGRLQGRAPRVAVALLYGVALVLQAPTWAFTPEQPPFDVLQVADRPDLALAGYRLQQVCGAALVAVDGGAARAHPARVRRGAASAAGPAVRVRPAGRAGDPGRLEPAAAAAGARARVRRAARGPRARAPRRRGGRPARRLPAHRGAERPRDVRRVLRVAARARAGGRADPRRPVRPAAAVVARRRRLRGRRRPARDAPAGRRAARAAVHVLVGERRLGAVVYDAAAQRRPRPGGRGRPGRRHRAGPGAAHARRCRRAGRPCRTRRPAC